MGHTNSGCKTTGKNVNFKIYYARSTVNSKWFAGRWVEHQENSSSLI